MLTEVQQATFNYAHMLTTQEKFGACNVLTGPTMLRVVHVVGSGKNVKLFVRKSDGQCFSAKTFTRKGAPLQRTIMQVMSDAAAENVK